MVDDDRTDWLHDHRGHWVGIRYGSGAGTDRIRRADGTWGWSEPTLVAADDTELRIGRLNRETGAVEVVAVLPMWADVRAEIDRLIEGDGITPEPGTG